MMEPKTTNLVRIITTIIIFSLFLSALSGCADQPTTTEMTTTSTPTTGPTTTVTRPTITPKPTATPVPTTTEPPLPDPALSAEELQWIGLGAHRSDILSMYYEGSNILDFRDLPIPESFIIEGGGSVAFEYTSAANPNDFEAAVFVTKIIMTDKSGQTSVIELPTNIENEAMAVQIGDFVLPISFDDDQTVLYADLIQSLGEPLSKSDGKTGADSDGSVKISGSVRSLSYDQLQVVLFQPDTLAGSDRWFCMQLRLSLPDLAGPGGVKVGMTQQDVITKLSTGAFQYSTTYDWNSDSWIAYARGKLASRDKVATNLWLIWNNGQLAEMFILLQGGAFGSIG